MHPHLPPTPLFIFFIFKKDPTHCPSKSNNIPTPQPLLFSKHNPILTLSDPFPTSPLSFLDICTQTDTCTSMPSMQTLKCENWILCVYVVMCGVCIALGLWPWSLQGHKISIDGGLHIPPQSSCAFCKLSSTLVVCKCPSSFSYFAPIPPFTHLPICHILLFTMLWSPLPPLTPTPPPVPFIL